MYSSWWHEKGELTVQPQKWHLDEELISVIFYLTLNDMNMKDYVTSPFQWLEYLKINHVEFFHNLFFFFMCGPNCYCETLYMQLCLWAYLSLRLFFFLTNQRIIIEHLHWERAELRINQVLKVQVRRYHSSQCSNLNIISFGLLVQSCGRTRICSYHLKKQIVFFL